MAVFALSASARGCQVAPRNTQCPNALNPSRPGLLPFPCQRERRVKGAGCCYCFLRSIPPLWYRTMTSLLIFEKDTTMITEHEMAAARNLGQAMMEFLVAWEMGRMARTPEPATPVVNVQMPDPPDCPQVQTEPTSTPDEPNRLISVGQVAELLQCSNRTVYRFADSGYMPRPRKLGNLVRWPWSEIQGWIADGCPKYRPR